MSVFAELAHLRPLPIWPGVLARAVEGHEMTLAVVELSPGSHVARHQHPNEQMGLVLRGALTFRVGSEERVLKAGDTYNIPALVPHDVTTGPEGAVVIDVFSPVRGDWRAFEPQAPRPPVWP
jgi:quercetin dioxygenase-like cupin family protein